MTATKRLSIGDFDKIMRKLEKLSQRVAKFYNRTRCAEARQLYDDIGAQHSELCSIVEWLPSERRWNMKTQKIFMENKHFVVRQQKIFTELLQEALYQVL